MRSILLCDTNKPEINLGNVLLFEINWKKLSRYKLQRIILLGT